MRLVVLLAAGLAIGAATQPASADTQVVSCPAKVRSLVNKLVIIENQETTAHYSWNGMSNRISLALLAERHIALDSMSAACFGNVYHPSTQAVLQYVKGDVLLQACGYSLCDKNHVSQAGRMWAAGNRSIDRAASNLP